TLFAFSADNWRRPPEEVRGLMSLFQYFLRREEARLVETGVRFTVIGRRDRLPNGLVRAMERVEQATASGRRLHLRVAVDYSARDAILRAAAEGPDALAQSPDVDLLIRTGGE